MSRRFATHDEAAAATLVDALGQRPLEGPVLLINEPQDAVTRALADSTCQYTLWLRRKVPDLPCSAWPPAGSFATAVFRYPAVTDEFRMGLAAAAARLPAGARLWVHGANDEGIKSVPAKLAPFFEGAGVVLIGNHCRVIEARRSAEPVGRQGTIDAWADTVAFEWAGATRTLVSFPGVFSAGRLDPGTAILLDHLSRRAQDSLAGHAVDFGAGIGIVAYCLKEWFAFSDVTLIDNDAVAGEACRRNLPGADFILARSLAEARPRPADLIVSNPPLHRGKQQTHEIVAALCRDAADALAPDGRLLIVTQQTVPVARFARGALAVNLLTQQSGYCLHECRPAT